MNLCLRQHYLFFFLYISLVWNFSQNDINFSTIKDYNHLQHYLSFFWLNTEQKQNLIMKRKFKQWWSTIPPISTKRTKLSILIVLRLIYLVPETNHSIFLIGSTRKLWFQRWTWTKRYQRIIWRPWATRSTWSRGKKRTKRLWRRGRTTGTTRWQGKII